MNADEHGPNVMKLIILKMSLDAIPDGGGFADGIEFFTNRDKRHRIITNAEEWVKQAIHVVRHASGPNPWHAASDEDISGEVIRRMEERTGSGLTSLTTCATCETNKAQK